MVTPNDNENALSEALRDNREEAKALRVHEDAKKEAAKRLGIGLNPAGTWGKKTELHFKAYYDPPRYGSIHYWLAYAREVLYEARTNRAAYPSEIKCAIIGLNSFASRDSTSGLAAQRIQEQLKKIAKGYTRRK
tara:strand:+ start:145 stop:546 length:402 start_codon:yes stop_codon:yes gene_type:complete